MRYRTLYPIVVSLVVVGLFVPIFFAFAQSPTEERLLLEEELRQLEEEIAEIEQDINTTKGEKRTLQNKISVLRGGVRKLNLQIYQSNKIIKDLRFQILDTASSIDKTAADIEFTKGRLADTLQLLYEGDESTIFEVLLVGDKLSDFFDSIAAIEALNTRNRDLLKNVRDLNIYLQTQKNTLESEKGEEEQFVRIQILQRQQSQSAQAEQEDLLNITKGKETEYQKLLKDRQKRAQEVRSRIFSLIGVPEAPTFGEAVTIAKAVASQTGVRPAFLLAILTQESNLGKNVGQCYMKDPPTGNGVSIRTGVSISRVMKPMGLSGRKGDVDDFLRITRNLGRDPYVTPVSCPIPSIGGYGGAMGPAQFIPTTWTIYESQLASMLGRPADPWNVKDAFLASGVFLGDLGADKQTYNEEWCAAVRYFSGRCLTKYRFYGNSVMAIAEQYEEDIKLLQD